MVERTLVMVFVLGLFLSAIIPLGISCARAARPTKEWSRACLYIATLSLTWLIAAAVFPVALGRFYTKSRYVLILANLLVMLVCTVVVFLRRSEWRRPLGLSCLMLTVMWFLVAAIN